MNLAEQSLQPTTPPWMRGFLLLAGTYNIFWGIFIYGWPHKFYQWVAQSAAPVPDIVSFQGMGVILFGIIYLLCALHPLKFWYLVWAGLFSKIAGAFGFYYLVMDQQWNKKFLFHLIMNDLAWVIPLGVIAIKFWRLRD